MKKNFIAGVISLAIVGMFGGVSFAADAAKPEVKADAPKTEKAEAPKAKKKVAKKKAAKKAEVKKEEVKAEAAK